LRPRTPWGLVRSWRFLMVLPVARQVMTDEATGRDDQDGWLLGH
jgi:hypothetical protein